MTITQISGVRGLAVFALSLALGCPKPSHKQAPDLTPDSGPPDAGPPADLGPRPIPGARATATSDAGLRLADPDAGDGGEATSSETDLSTPDASIPDWARLTFSAAVPLEDFRARLLGSDGQLVPNHAEAWVADGGTTVVFLPASLWPTHGCCRLVVDGQTEKLATSAGSRFLPFEVDFAVAADPDRPQPPPRPKKRHHRRR